VNLMVGVASSIAATMGPAPVRAANWPSAQGLDRDVALIDSLNRLAGAPAQDFRRSPVDRAPCAHRRIVASTRRQSPASPCRRFTGTQADITRLPRKVRVTGGRDGRPPRR
jgi:hypothetical protein